MPIDNCKYENISHEIVHAIVAINKLKVSDSESIAYKVGEEVKEFFKPVLLYDNGKLL